MEPSNASTTFKLDLHIPDVSVLLEEEEIYSTPSRQYLLDWYIAAEEDKVNGVSCLAIYLHCTKEHVPTDWVWECKATFKITLKNQQKGHPEKDLVKRKTSFDTFSNADESGYGCSNFLKFDDLMDEENGFILDGGIHIQIKVSAEPPTGLHYLEKMQIQSSFEDSSTPARHILRMLESREGADVVILTKGNVEVQAHRVILAGASKSLKAIYGAKVTNGKGGEVRTTMEDLHSTSCEALLRFIYTGDCSHLEELKLMEVKELINAGERYGLAELKRYCGYLIVERCSFKNALKLHQFVTSYGMGGTAEEISSFAKGHFSQVWGQLSSNMHVQTSDSEEEME